MSYTSKKQIVLDRVFELYSKNKKSGNTKINIPLLICQVLKSFGFENRKERVSELAGLFRNGRNPKKNA